MISLTREFSIHNFDENYRQWGIATLPWSGVSAWTGDRVKVTDIRRVDKPGSRVFAQVDAIDPDDHEHDVLTIFVDDWLRGGGFKVGLEVARVEITFQIDDRTYTAAELAKDAQDRAESVRDTQNFWVHNEGAGHIGAYVFFPEGPKRWQGGAITSVIVDGSEILDAPNADDLDKHDSEKRLQLDRVLLPNAPWEKEPATEHSLYRMPWTFVAAGGGNLVGGSGVRMWVNLRSSSFKHPYKDAAGNVTTYECHAYRVISVFRHSQHIIEDLYVKGKPVQDEPAAADIGTSIRFYFAPHYFLKMQFVDAPVLTHVPGIPDWFSIGTYRDPSPGFGFAATATVNRIDAPPEDYPTVEQQKAAFGWQLGYGFSIRCVSLFGTWISPQEMADDTGRAWFELMYKPLQARVI